MKTKNIILTFLLTQSVIFSAAAATSTQNRPNILFVLDISGSMNDAVGGQKKIDTLKSVFKQTMSGLNKANVGLTYYGMQTSDYPNGILFPVSPIKEIAKNILEKNGFSQNNDNISVNANPNEEVKHYLPRLVNSFTPGGFTPIVDSLYESYLYFAGKTVYFGKNIPTYYTAAHPSTYGFPPISSVAIAPVESDCQIITNSTDGGVSNYNYCTGKKNVRNCTPPVNTKIQSMETDCCGWTYTKNGEQTISTCTGGESYACGIPNDVFADVSTCKYDYPQTELSHSPVYFKPARTQCQSNAIVFLSDGKPEYSWDREPLSANTIKGLLATGTCEDSPYGFKAGTCGKELTHDLLLDHEKIKTYTIGFGITNKDTRDYLQSLTTGDYFDAGNTSQLKNAFNSIINSITGAVSDTQFNSSFNLESGDNVFIPSNSVSEVEGHLKAYPVSQNGLVGTTEAFDVASLMDNTRGSKLYSSNNQGIITNLANMNNSFFETNGIPDKNIIVKYTIDPSYMSGSYLAPNRKMNSFLGPLAGSSTMKILDKDIDTFAYLNSANYRTYFNNTMRFQEDSILLSSNDGFLYNFKESNGELNWAYMPRSLIKELKNNQSFLDNKFMDGSIETVVVANSRSTVNRFVLGSYKSGLGHFVLELKDISSGNSEINNLKKVIWEDDLSSNYIEANIQGEISVFKNNTNNKDAYMTYALRSNGGNSTLFIKSIANTDIDYSIDFGFSITSKIHILVFDKRNHNNPEKFIYFGTSNGQIRGTSLLDSSGNLKTETALRNDLLGATPFRIEDSAPIRYLGSLPSINNKFLLRAQTDHRLTIFEYDKSSGAFKKKWTTSIPKAGTYDPNESYTESTTIQKFPTGSIISDETTVIASTVIVPVTTQGNSCFGEAYYYFYNLEDGNLPPKRLFNARTDAIVSSPVKIGNGTAYTMTTAYIKANTLGTSRITAFSQATQRVDGTTGVDSFYLIDNYDYGIRSWKELH